MDITKDKELKKISRKINIKSFFKNFIEIVSIYTGVLLFISEGSFTLILSLLATSIMSNKFIKELIEENKTIYYNKTIQKYFNNADYNINQDTIYELDKLIIKHNLRKFAIMILLTTLAIFLKTNTNFSINTLAIGMGLSYSTIMSIESSIIESLNIKKELYKKLPTKPSNKDDTQTKYKILENEKDLSNQKNKTKQEQIEELKNLRDELTKTNKQGNKDIKTRKKKK